MNDSRDDSAWLADWSDAAAAAIERDIVRYAAVPDLADVLARARAADPDAVPPEWDALLGADEGVVPFAQARALQRDVPDPMVAMFASALRGEVETGLRERQLSAIPAAPQRRRRWPIVAAVSLAAAALVAWLAAPQLLERMDPAQQESSAAQTVAPTEGSEAWSARAPAPAPIPEPAAQATTGEVEVAETSGDGDTGEPSSKRRSKPPSLDALEADALAAWQRGDLANAERLLLRIARGPRSGRAELAYGDLFAVARQRRGAAGQVAMWRDYLRRYPSGRFADDARAGLCRRAEDAGSSRTCWEDYLRHHPSGTHALAERWTQAAP